MKCKICGNDMILGDLGWYCDKDEEHYENVMPLTEEQKDKLIEHRFKQVSDMRRQITDLQSQFAQKDKQLEKLKSENHALISDNAYQESDIFELNSRIEQLQKQLEESESKRKSLEEKVKFITEEKEANFVDGQKYNELKEQFVESEKSKESYRLQNEQHHLQLLQFYSRLGVEAFGADIHEKALETLMIMKDQLAEKEKEIESYKHFKITIGTMENNQVDISSTTYTDQDKISFAVEQLEKVKEWCENHKFSDEYDYVIAYEEDEEDASGCEDYFKDYIDNQIKQLKEKNNG